MISLKKLILESNNDNQYLELIKNKDENFVQEMVEIAAKRNGYNIGPVYHNTLSNEDFYIFKPNIKKRFDGTVATKYGLIYFSADRGYVHSKWVKRTITVFLKMKNTWDFRNEHDVNSLSKYLETLNIKGHNSETIKFTISKGQWSMIENYGIDFIKESGYDSIIMLESPSTPLTYVVFESNQAKLFNSITYDDNEQIIPLSQRFDSSNDDIRY